MEKGIPLVFGYLGYLVWEGMVVGDRLFSIVHRVSHENTFSDKNVEMKVFQPSFFLLFCSPLLVS